jgi:hypothetical protein
MNRPPGATNAGNAGRLAACNYQAFDLAKSCGDGILICHEETSNEEEKQT